MQTEISICHDMSASQLAHSALRQAHLLREVLQWLDVRSDLWQAAACLDDVERLIDRLNSAERYQLRRNGYGVAEA
jgi:hypothetical protein